MKSNLKTSDALNPADCVSSTLRRAARTAARFYDDALRPSGLRSTQFTLLGALKTLGAANIGELSERLSMDGTTLTRNLEVLVRRGLVENLSVDDARVRNVGLTSTGEEAFDNAAPLWREAQRHVLAALGPGPWAKARNTLRKIETACDR